MAKQPAPSQQPVPATEPEDQDRSVEPFELTPAALANRTSTSTTVPEEILARGDDRRYATHWGINE
jgi:hypothetical protein